MLSFGERLLRKYLKKCFGKEEVEFNYRDAGIYNPATHMPLELDLFYPNLMIAFEFQGKQHKTDEEQKHRDQIKKEQCKKKHILLFTIWAKDLKSNLYEKIKDKIEEHSGFKIKKPREDFLKLYDETTNEYRKNLAKLHKKIDSDKFVKVKKNGKRIHT